MHQKLSISMVSPKFFYRKIVVTHLLEFSSLEPESYSNPFAAEIEARQHMSSPQYQDDFLENIEKP